MKRLTYLLPILAGCLTVLSLAAQNADRTDWGAIWLPLGLVAGYSIVVFGVFWLMPWFRRVSPLLATIFILTTLLWSLFPLPPVVPVLIATILSMVVILVSPKRIVAPLTAITAVACVLSLGQFAITGNPSVVSASHNTITLSQTPDIYFIVPDRFPSPEALRETGYDPAVFVQSLRDRGFYVREDALSSDPYRPGDDTVKSTRTMRFLATTLNLGVDIPLDISYRLAGDMIKSPAVIDILHSNGYTCHHIGSWFPETAFSATTDINHAFETYSLASRIYGNLFSATVVDRSIFRSLNSFPFMSKNSRGEVERSRQLFQSDTIKQVAMSEGSPVYVFAHIILPHPDYYWTADGKPQSSTTLSQQEMYLEQIKFTEGYLLDIADEILVSNPDALIIIQADEGMAYVDAELNSNLSNTQWNGCLTTWYIPGQEGLDGVQVTDILKYIVDTYR